MSAAKNRYYWPLTAPLRVQSSACWADGPGAQDQAAAWLVRPGGASKLCQAVTQDFPGPTAQLAGEDWPVLCFLAPPHVSLRVPPIPASTNTPIPLTGLGQSSPPLPGPLPQGRLWLGLCAGSSAETDA